LLLKLLQLWQQLQLRLRQRLRSQQVVKAGMDSKRTAPEAGGLLTDICPALATRQGW
jgi:hypothetical protein